MSTAQDIAAETALSARVALVIRRHLPPPGGQRGTPHCTECGFAWPCPTVAILRGDASSRQWVRRLRTDPAHLAGRAKLRQIVTLALAALPGVPADRAYTYAGVAVTALDPVLSELEALAATRDRGGEPVTHSGKD